MIAYNPKDRINYADIANHDWLKEPGVINSSKDVKNEVVKKK
jgi:hypothetical protein